MPRPKPLTDEQAQRSFANRFGRTADNLRQLATKFGIRPYRVFLVWQKWTGVERFEGDPVTLLELEILPTPEVQSLDSVAVNPLTAGMLQMGMVRVKEVSTSLTYEQLKGLAIPGQPLLDHIPQPFSFFYELREDGRSGVKTVRRKYRLATEPTRDAGNVQWVLTLEKISEDRNRDGQSEYAKGTQG